MPEQTWTPRDGVPLRQCPQCGSFPEDPYDSCCGECDGGGVVELVEVLYVPKALLDEAEAKLSSHEGSEDGS